MRLTKVLGSISRSSRNRYMFSLNLSRCELEKEEENVEVVIQEEEGRK